MIFKAWTTGRWAGFSENVIGIVNHRFNPFYAIGAHSFYAYLSGQSHDWRGAFRHGTIIATVLTILAVVTAGKGVAGALKKGNGAATLGAAEEAATQKAVQSNGKQGVPYSHLENHSNGCGALLPRMLPPNSRLRVIGPEGYDQTFIGKAK